MSRDSGFTVLEMVVAMALTVTVVAAVFTVVGGGPDAFAVQTEVSDMHQRLRVASGTLIHDLMSATAVRPYRSHGPDADPPGTVTSDTLTAIGNAAMTTYWLKRDRAGTYQLMSYAGGGSADVPVVDNIVALAFDYVGDPAPPTIVRPLTDPTGPWTTYGPPPAAGAVPPFAAGENCIFVDDGSGTPAPRLAVLAPPPASLIDLPAALFSDGPWCPDDASADRWDADLLRVRAVVVTVRVQAAAAALRGPTGPLFAHGGTSNAPSRWAPDVEVRVQVAPRNLNAGR